MLDTFCRQITTAFLESSIAFVPAQIVAHAAKECAA